MTNRTLVILAVMAVLLTAAAMLPPAGGFVAPEPVLPGGAHPDSLRLDADGRRVMLRAGTGSAWSGTEGRLDEERSRRVAALANGLVDLDRGTVVARRLPVDDLARFGLEDPRRTVASWSHGSAVQLAFGDSSPLPGEVYACVRDAGSEHVDVFLLPSGLSSAIAEIARDFSGQDHDESD